MSGGTCSDGTFGPIVHGCRSNFDVTLLFENTILSLTPSILVFGFSTLRISSLWKKPNLINARTLQISKLTALIVYTICQVVLVILWSANTNIRSWSSILAASFSLCVALTICVLSPLEHTRSLGPSTILIAYLFFSTIFDSVRCRTIWLSDDGSSLPWLLTISTVLKAFVLLLESVEKSRYLPADLRHIGPEETSSVLNRGTFYWLNCLMITGSRHVLQAKDLYSLDRGLETEVLMPNYLNNWQKCNHSQQDAALWATVRTLKNPLLVTMIPRAVLLTMTICQPLLVRQLLAFLAKPADERSTNVGYGLIGGYALVYMGTAVSNGFYLPLHYRFLIKIRGCLISAIAWQTAKLNIQAIKEPKTAVALMSTDTERIIASLRPLHDFWASTVQVCIAMYLLQEQMGIACLVPVVVSVLCTIITASISPEANKRQVKWLEAVDTRLSITSVMLSAIEGVKMRGLINSFLQKIRLYRAEELGRAKSWRMVILSIICFSFIPEWVSPVITFMVYVLKARGDGQVFDSTRAFTTLSLLIVMTQPMNQLVGSFPELAGAVGCFRRIGKFLAAEEQQDFRDFESGGGYGAKSKAAAQIIAEVPDAIELAPRKVTPSTSDVVRGQPIIRITDGSFGWTGDSDILKEINIAIPKGCLTLVVGPVASGKSTLCKAFLSETYISKGNIKMLTSAKDIGFCDQTAHLAYGTIMENIIGFSPLDESWYATVLRSCALVHDVAEMPNKNHTHVGSGGVSLSGGQRQKVALARALYARKPIVILDDALSGFDAESERHVFHEVLGPRGLLQRLAITVIFATNAVRFLPYADHVIALGTDGRMLQEGTYETVRQQAEYVQALATEPKPQGEAIAPKDDMKEIKAVDIKAETAKKDLARQTGDLRIYRYYFGAAGLWATTLMLTFGICCSVFFNLSTLWLQLWVNASAKPGQLNQGLWLGVYGSFQILSVVFLVLVSYSILILVVSGTGTSLHAKLLDTVSRASLTFFSMTDKGSIVNHFSQDVQLVDMQLPIALSTLVLCVFVGIGQILLVVASSPWVGVTLPAILTIFYFVQKFYLRTSRQLRLLDLEAKTPLYTNFLETLSGLATVRAFGWAQLNLELNKRLLNESQKPMYLLYMIQRWLTFVIDMVIACVATIIAGLAVSQRSNHGFTGIALTNVMLVNLTLRGVISAWTEVETSIGAVHRIKHFSENTPQEPQPRGTDEPGSNWPQNGSVEVSEALAVYDTATDKPALNKLSLSIRAGQKLGICGRSGSGKSSFILALLRMLELQGGSISIDGVNLTDVPADTIRERLNVIPQHSLLIPGTVRSNLDPYGTCTDTGMIQALQETQLWSVFEPKGGLEASIRNEALSHGQRQLFCLAAAILRKSRVVILDEVTSNVDHKTDEIMQSVIREEFEGCTMIVVTHRLNTIMDLDTIAVLGDGMLLELDTPGNLMAKESKFKSMAREQGLC